MLEQVDIKEVEGASAKFGPRTEITIAAQAVIDEFIESDADACRVIWRELADDFDVAKRQLSARISWTTFYNEVKDVGLRSNRPKQEIYLIRKDRLNVG